MTPNPTSAIVVHRNNFKLSVRESEEKNVVGGRCGFERVGVGVGIELCGWLICVRKGVGGNVLYGRFDRVQARARDEHINITPRQFF